MFLLAEWTTKSFTANVIVHAHIKFLYLFGQAQNWASKSDH